MSDSSTAQGGNLLTAAGGTAHQPAASSISANSFRALTAKLMKKPGAVSPAQVAAVEPPETLRGVTQPVELQPIPSISIVPAETTIAFSPPAPPSFETKPAFAPAPVPSVASVTSAAVPQSRPISGFSVEAQAVPSFALTEGDDAETATLELMAQRAPEHPPEHPQEHVPELTFAQENVEQSWAPEIAEVVAPAVDFVAPEPEQVEPVAALELAAPEEVPPPAKYSPSPGIPPAVEAIDAKRREATFAELDLIARMVYSKPTVEDRKQYLKEVAAIEEAEKFSARPLSPIRQHQNIAEQPPLLEMELPQEEFLAEVPADLEFEKIAPPQAALAMEVVQEAYEFASPSVSAEILVHAEQSDVAIETPFLSDELAGSFDTTLLVQPAITAQELSAETRLLPTVPAALATHQVVPLSSLPAGSASQMMSDAEAGELARTLLDMMASSTNGGLPQERALAADTLLRLYDRLPAKPLVMLSERLAIMNSPPGLLVGKVIRDPRIEVAGPLLENSPHIADQELLNVVDEGNPAKLRLIARRRKLTRTISDRLVAISDASVHLTLVRNASAEISHNGFLALTEAAKTEHDIMAPLTTRNDISAPFAFELFWMAPAQLRRYILNRFLTDSETLNKILKITMAAQGQAELPADGNPVVAQVLEALQLGIAGKLPEAAEMLSTPVRISALAGERILNDNLGEPLAVMLKAIGFPRSELVQLLGMLQSSDFSMIERDRDIEELAAIFDTLSFNKARILLTYWDWAATRSGPYAPVH